MLKIFTHVIQIDPQALLKTNFKGVTKFKKLFAKTAQLKPQAKQNKTVFKTLVNLKKFI